MPPPPAPPRAESDLAGGSSRDRFGYHVLRSGSARPAAAADLMGSEAGTCAYRTYRLDPGAEYAWREVQDADKRYPPLVRVYVPGAVCHVPRSTFLRLFPGADS